MQANDAPTRTVAPSNAAQSDSKSWFDKLDDAVARTDEPAIWRLMEEQSSQEGVHDTLASLVSRMAYVYGETNVYSELLMMPIVTMPGCDIMNNAMVWQGVRHQMSSALARWFNDDGKTTLFDAITPMDWITTWRPSILRAHLTRLVPNAPNSNVTFETSTIALPDDAPRLGFVVIGRTSNKGWRELPNANPLMDQRLKDVVKHCLQIQAPTPAGLMAPEPIVLTPERIPYAIADGVSLWLNKLHECVGIDGWTVMPSGVSNDVVKITLRLQSTDVELTQFTLRLHQIGNQGLHDVLSMLQHLAPMFENKYNEART
jgi:hypothetical protein